MFCKYVCIPPIPASSLSLCMYAAFLAQILKQSSIPGYLNITGPMHKEFGMPNPLTDNCQVSSVLKGHMVQPPDKCSPLLQTPPSLSVVH